MFKRYQMVRGGIVMIDPLSMGQEWDNPLYHPASFGGFKMVSGVAVCPNAASFRARHHSQQHVLGCRDPKLRGGVSIEGWNR